MAVVRPKIRFSLGTFLVLGAALMIPAALYYRSLIAEKVLLNDPRYCFESESLACSLHIGIPEPESTPYDYDPWLRPVYVELFRSRWAEKVRSVTPEVLMQGVKAFDVPPIIHHWGPIRSRTMNVDWARREAEEDADASWEVFVLEMHYHSYHCPELIQSYAEFHNRMRQDRPCIR